MNFLKVLTVSSVSIWLGAVIFFSIFTAPAAFAVLDRESAGRLVSTVFPRYYVFGAVLGLLALAGAAGRFFGSAGREGPWGSLALLVLMLALTFYTLSVLLPQTESARLAMHVMKIVPGSAAPEARHFARLHRISVALNGITLLAGLAVVCLEAVRSRG